MKLNCELIPVTPQGTLADLEFGVAARVIWGASGIEDIKWRDGKYVYGIEGGCPVCTNDSRTGYKFSDYKVLEILGRISMNFEE